MSDSFFAKTVKKNSFFISFPGKPDYIISSNREYYLKRDIHENKSIAVECSGAYAGRMLRKQAAAGKNNYGKGGIYERKNLFART